MTSLRHVALLIALCALTLSACKKDEGAKVDTKGLTKVTCEKGGVKIELMIPKGYRDSGAEFCSWQSGADTDGEDEDEDEDEGGESGLITVEAVKKSKTIDDRNDAIAHSIKAHGEFVTPQINDVKTLDGGDFLVPLAPEGSTKADAFDYYAKGSTGYVVAYCTPKSLERTCRTLKNLK